MAAVPLGTDAPKHVLAVPTSDEQLREMSSTYIAGGLAAGEQVSYFDDGTADAVLERLSDDGVALDDPMRTGQLTIVPAEFTRAALMAPMDELNGLLEQNIEAAVSAGWRGLRFTGQMSHGLERPGGVVLDEYDAVLDRVLREQPAHALCFYDAMRYPDWLIERMRDLHGDEATAPAVYDDELLRVTREARGVIRLAGEIDHSNRQQVRRLLAPMLDRALRSAGGPVDVEMDVTSLRFCDVATATSVVHAAEEFPAACRLVLRGARPRVTRLLERCGSTTAPQLDLRARRRA